MQAPRRPDGMNVSLRYETPRSASPGGLGAWIAVCASLLFLPFLALLATGRVFAHDDLAAFHLPMRHLYREALRGSDSILWTPALYSGFYLHGEGQAGMAHPLHWALYRWLPLTSAFTLEIFASYVVAFVGMIFFARRLEFGRPASVFGALMFAFSGFNLLHLNHVNAVAVFAHLPLLLLVTDVLLTARGRSQAVAFVALAGLVGSQLLLGFPQSVWMALLVVTWFVSFRVSTGAPWRQVAWVCLAIALGVLIGGVQLLPTIDQANAGIRSSVPLAFRLTVSLHPMNLMQLWSPYVFKYRVYELPLHEFGLYDSAFATAAFVWLVARWRRLRRPSLTIWLIGLALVGLWFSLGRYGALYAWLARLPGIDGFRAPSRHIAIVHFAFAMLAAMALEELVSVARRESVAGRRELGALGALAALSFATAIAAPMLATMPLTLARQAEWSELSRAMVGFVLMGATVSLMLLIARGAAWVLPVLIILVVADLALWGYRYNLWWNVPPQTLASLMPEQGVPVGARPGDVLYAQLGDVNKYVLGSFRISNVYVALTPRSTLDPGDAVAQRLAGVRWTFASNHWTLMPGTMPRARLVTDVRVGRATPAAIKSLDVATTALVQQPIGDIGGSPGEARVLIDRPGYLVIETSADGAQLLVLTERFHGGWRASEGEHVVHTIPVNGDYLGCVVGAGTRRIAFRFQPASARAGIVTSAVGLALTCICALGLGHARSGYDVISSD